MSGHRSIRARNHIIRIFFNTFKITMKNRYTTGIESTGRSDHTDMLTIIKEERTNRPN